MISPGRRRGLPALLLLLVVAALAAAGCAAPAPSPAFDPASACTTDGRRPGAYPELEALLPPALDGVAPNTVDSGRSCTSEALGSLHERGIRELRYAGATWDRGSEQGVTYAVFEAAGLDPATMIEFYEAGARATGRAEALQVRPFELAGAAGVRLDTIHRSVGQTIIAWPGDEPGRVQVVLVSATGEPELIRILEALIG
ncbi:MAG TPA: hypothetical protein VFK54_13665 [Candidatus Limnocylindrales bacterium]|nr:hypothetical protein [Candidatus Limnocylindrales bacterium]